MLDAIEIVNSGRKGGYQCLLSLLPMTSRRMTARFGLATDGRASHHSLSLHTICNSNSYNDRNLRTLPARLAEPLSSAGQSQLRELRLQHVCIHRIPFDILPPACPAGYRTNPPTNLQTTNS